MMPSVNELHKPILKDSGRKFATSRNAIGAFSPDYTQTHFGDQILPLAPCTNSTPYHPADGTRMSTTPPSTAIITTATTP